MGKIIWRCRNYGGCAAIQIRNGHEMSTLLPSTTSTMISKRSCSQTRLAQIS